MRDPSVSAFRASVATRALNMLPHHLGPDAATRLVSCGAPRVVTQHALPLFTMLVLVLAAAIVGWAACALGRSTR